MTVFKCFLVELVSTSIGSSILTFGGFCAGGRGWLRVRYALYLAEAQRKGGATCSLSPDSTSNVAQGRDV